MRTLGVDLASQPANTSVAVLEGTTVAELHSTADDDTIVELAARCDAVGIDAPLGWPDAFVAMVNAHHRGDALPGAEPGAHFQFERLGYFCIDTLDSRPGAPVFNRTVTLRDSWAKAARNS